MENKTIPLLKLKTSPLTNILKFPLNHQRLVHWRKKNKKIKIWKIIEGQLKDFCDKIILYRQQYIHPTPSGFYWGKTRLEKKSPISIIGNSSDVTNVHRVQWPLDGNPVSRLDCLLDSLKNLEDHRGHWNYYWDARKPNRRTLYQNIASNTNNPPEYWRT